MLRFLWHPSPGDEVLVTDDYLVIRNRTSKNIKGQRGVIISEARKGVYRTDFGPIGVVSCPREVLSRVKE